MPPVRATRTRGELDSQSSLRMTREPTVLIRLLKVALHLFSLHNMYRSCPLINFRSLVGISVKDSTLARGLTVAVTVSV